MEALVNIITDVGLIGSVALLVWGMVLCVRYGFGIDTAGPQRTALGDGALGRRSARAAMGV